MQLYAEGNAAFVESRFVDALSKFRKAIGYWDHPAIRFNMVVCLINLDRLIEAREHLDRGLAHGPAPLGEDAYKQALTYRKLLDARLSRLTITCEEGPAEVTLDGEYLFDGAGAVVRYVLPGAHHIVATKPGFLIRAETVVLEPGKDEVHNIRLVTLQTTAPMAPRWSRWKPLAILAVGGAVTALGGMAFADARRAMAMDQDADGQQWVGASMMVFGGTMLVTSIAMMAENLPQAVPAPTLLPSVKPMPGGAAVAIQGGF